MLSKKEQKSLSSTTVSSMRGEKSTNVAGKDLIVVYLIVDVATFLVSNQEKCLSKVTVSSERRIGLKDVVEAEHSLEA